MNITFYENLYNNNKLNTLYNPSMANTYVILDYTSFSYLLNNPNCPFYSLIFIIFMTSGTVRP